MNVSTKQFSFKANQFVAEVSDFGRQFEFSQVYKDSADEGLTLVSHKTGHEVTYVVNHTEYDAEGDLKYWDLVPADHRHLKHPCHRGALVLAKGTSIRIFND